MFHYFGFVQLYMDRLYECSLARRADFSAKKSRDKTPCNDAFPPLKFVFIALICRFQI